MGAAFAAAEATDPPLGAEGPGVLTAFFRVFSAFASPRAVGGASGVSEVAGVAAAARAGRLGFISAALSRRV